MAKLVLDWDEEDLPGTTLALRSDLEPYRVAFWLNDGLRINLNRMPKPLEQKRATGQGTYDFFRHTGDDVEPWWWLVCNRPTQWAPRATLASNDLFSTLPAEEKLLPQWQQWDYFLSLRAPLFDDLITESLPRIQQIAGIFATFALPSKDNQWMLSLLPD